MQFLEDMAFVFFQIMNGFESRITHEPTLLSHIEYGNFYT